MGLFFAYLGLYSLTGLIPLLLATVNVEITPRSALITWLFWPLAVAIGAVDLVRFISSSLYHNGTHNLPKSFTNRIVTRINAVPPPPVVKETLPTAGHPYKEASYYGCTFTNEEEPDIQCHVCKEQVYTDDLFSTPHLVMGGLIDRGWIMVGEEDALVCGNCVTLIKELTV